MLKNIIGKFFRAPSSVSDSDAVMMSTVIGIAMKVGITPEEFMKLQGVTPDKVEFMGGVIAAGIREKKEMANQ